METETQDQAAGLLEQIEKAPESAAPAPSSLELVFGLVAPVGVDLNLVTEVLADTLREVSFASEFETLHLTKLMRQVPVPQRLTSKSYIDSVDDRIAYANKVRERLGDDGLAILAISAIRSFRAASAVADQSAKGPDIGPGPAPFSDEPPEERPLPNQAYIVRQLKRPEEIQTLRRVYGKRFILISAYAPIKVRKRHITEAESKTRGGLQTDLEIEARVNDLIARDSMESGVDHGQAVRDAFPLGDVFIDATSRMSCEETLRRFIRLFFGDNQITPTRDEYAMYIAKSVALRSSDLSRQVGAAIFSTSGEVVTLGCNEVPKAGGGTYWEDSEEDGRDFALGYDPNERLKQEVLVDLIDRLQRHGDLADGISSQKDAVEIADTMLADETRAGVAKSRLMDIIEFGRIIHAEMSAISDAARKGLAVYGATLYCTTFPCHLCAKHIVAAGLKRVVFLEPYPKSYAWKLHSDSIEVDERGHERKVCFEAFIGVSPYRYRDVFEKKMRKKDGVAQKWNQGSPSPMIDIFYPDYFRAEVNFVANLKVKLKVLEQQATQPAVPPIGTQVPLQGAGEPEVAPDE